MEEHPSYLVFLHLPEFFKSRGLRAVAPDSLATTRERFVLELTHLGFYRVDAEDAAGHRTILLILSLQGKHTEQGPLLRGLIYSLDTDRAARDRLLSEVIVIAPEEVLGKKNMTDVIKGIRVEAAKADRTKALAGHYNMYPYHVFQVNIPRASIVPLHEIVPTSEARAFLERERLAISDLRRIPATSPPIVWIGARPGQMVRITAVSETAGQTVDYCVVIR